MCRALSRGKSGPNPYLVKTGPAGIIHQVGAGVPAKRVGERVWVFEAARGRPYGTSADFTVVPSGQVVLLRDSASFDLGAALGFRP